MRKQAYALTVVGIGVLGCGSKHPESDPIPPLAHAISADVAAKLGEPVALWCIAPFGMGHCEATLLHTHQVVVIDVIDDGKAWSWQLAPPNVSIAPVEKRVHERLIELGADQAVDCGARIQPIASGARIECKLAGGGAAFVAMTAKHVPEIELALDAAAAAARRDDVNGLAEKSKALDTTGSDGGSNETE